MLIKFNEIVKKYGKPKGIIHIGAHLLEERNEYFSLGLDNTIWIEANPIIFEQIKNVGIHSKEKIFNYAISNIDDEILKLNVTNNGQSSSILELDKHKSFYPQIYVNNVIDVKSKRMDTLLDENSININDYDFLNIDIQGAELLALESFGNKLSFTKYIYVEVNLSNLYKNCPLIYDIDNFLKKYNFERVETHITEFEWGDAFYIKKNDYDNF